MTGIKGDNRALRRRTARIVCRVVLSGRDLSLSGGSGVLGIRNAALRPLMINGVSSFGQNQGWQGWELEAGRGQLEGQLASQLEPRGYSSWRQLGGPKLLRLPGEQDGQVPRHGVSSRPYQSQQLRSEGTGGLGGIDGVASKLRRELTS